MTGFFFLQILRKEGDISTGGKKRPTPPSLPNTIAPPTPKTRKGKKAESVSVAPAGTLDFAHLDSYVVDQPPTLRPDAHAYEWDTGSGEEMYGNSLA